MEDFVGVDPMRAGTEPYPGLNPQRLFLLNGNNNTLLDLHNDSHEKARCAKASCDDNTNDSRCHFFWNNYYECCGVDNFIPIYRDDKTEAHSNNLHRVTQEMAEPGLTARSACSKGVSFLSPLPVPFILYCGENLPGNFLVCNSEKKFDL